VTEYDKEIIQFAQQLLGLPKLKADPPPDSPRAAPQAARIPAKASPKAPPKASNKPPPSSPETTLEARAENTGTPRARETKTAEELARMIEADLARHPKCPREGLVVTVYGTTFWRAMLTITPAAGPLRNPQEWRDLTEELGYRLRERYDLAWRQS
jgi:hypothetical protein